MSKKLKFLIPLIALLFVFILLDKDNKDYDSIRKQHKEFLLNSPYKNTKNLTKQERKNIELPPNAYAERMWELSMNPYTGRTEPEKLFYLQKELREMRNPQNRISGVPGEPNNDETKWQTVHQCRIKNDARKVRLVRRVSSPPPSCDACT